MRRICSGLAVISAFLWMTVVAFAVPDAELHVTPNLSGPGCCWSFDLTQVWGAPGNIAVVTGQVITPGAIITSATGFCGGPTTNTSTIVTTIIPGGLIPSTPPGVPTCSLKVCFQSSISPTITIVFTGYDAAGNTTPCPNPPSNNCLLVDTVSIQNPNCIGGCVHPPANLVLWLPFNEPAGPTANNAAGGNNGTHVGAPTVINQYVKRGLCFNGVNQWVNVKTYPAINFGPAGPGTNQKSDFTIDCWVKPEPNAAGVRTIVDKRLDSAGGVYGYHMFLFNGLLSFQLANGVGVNYNSTVMVPPDNQWHFVAVTVKRNDPNGLAFYMDGAAVGPTFSTIPHNGSLATKAPFRVAARTASTPGSAVFIGCIDEMEVFSRVLTLAELGSIYGAKSDGKCDKHCYVPSVTPICVNQSSVTVTAQICNYTGSTQTFNYSFAGPPVSSGCTWPGPTTFSPASGSVTIPTGTCATFPVVITKPTGLPCNAVSCYEMTVFYATPIGVETFYCHGALRGVCKWCFIFPTGPIGIPTNITFPAGPIVVTNTDTQPGMLDYQLVVKDHEGNPDQDAIRLNGLPPGEPVLGTLSLAPGGFVDINLDVDFAVDNPLETYEIILEGDLDGDGIPEPLGCMAVQNELPPTYVPGDADGDESIDISDAVYLIAYIFGGGPAPDPYLAGDANCDLSVDISDAVYLIAYIFGGGPAPCTP